MALTKQRSDTWLRQVPERSAQDNAASLICFPHAGGSARYYFPLMGSLNSMDVTVVQYPGRDDRRFESPIPSIAALADEVTQAILDGPRSDREIAAELRLLGGCSHDAALRER
jgi:pyochelin biosynthesis protein PchC